MNHRVLEAQVPLRRQYEQAPSAALVTDHARTGGIDPADPFHSRVAPMDGCGVVLPVSVHRALGGPHDAPTPGDILCAALAACQDSSIRMVANLLGVELTALAVRVSGVVDVRGALGMHSDIPVGFQSLCCEVELTAREGTPPELVDRLYAAAQRSCVIHQTLRHPPPIQTTFRQSVVKAGEVK
jgi:uncharacterized OsmC-like protein